MYDSLYLSIIFGSAIVQKEDQVPNCSRNRVIVVSSLSTSSYIIKKKVSTSSQDKSVMFSLLGMVKGGQGKGVQ